MTQTAANRIARTRPPAKLNLFLELSGKRPDGYHEIDTVMVPIDWCDELTVRRRDRPGVEVRSRWLPSESIVAGRLGISDDPARREEILGLPSGGANLVHRALERVCQRFDAAAGFSAELRKRIPLGAGLGGASSDAAAALRCAALLLGIPADRPALTELAAELGSDVPFFLGLSGRPVAAARARGRGERLDAVRRTPELFFVVAYPAQSLSTAAVYAESRLPQSPNGSEEMIIALDGGSPANVAACLSNRLADPARRRSPRIAKILDGLAQCGLMAGQVTGSGSACFAIAATAERAKVAAATLRGRLQPGALVTPARAIHVPPGIVLG